MKINTVTKTYNPDTSNFTGYSVTLENSTNVILVPLDEANTDYQAIQEWAAIDGNNITDPGA